MKITCFITLLRYKPAILTTEVKVACFLILRFGYTRCTHCQYSPYSFQLIDHFKCEKSVCEITPRGYYSLKRINSHKKKNVSVMPETEHSHPRIKCVHEQRGNTLTATTIAFIRIGIIQE